MGRCICRKNRDLIQQVIRISVDWNTGLCTFFISPLSFLPLIYLSLFHFLSLSLSHLSEQILYTFSA
jgi:hypothetical protein